MGQDGSKCCEACLASNCRSSRSRFSAIFLHEYRQSGTGKCLFSIFAILPNACTVPLCCVSIKTTDRYRHQQMPAPVVLCHYVSDLTRTRQKRHHSTSKPSPDTFHDMFVYESGLIRRDQGTTICFTICFFISPDLDGHRAPQMRH